MNTENQVPETITCKQALAKVYEYIDGETDAQSELEIRKHLSTCESCYGEFQFERMIKDKIKSLTATKHKTDAFAKLEKILSKIT